MFTFPSSGFSLRPALVSAAFVLAAFSGIAGCASSESAPFDPGTLAGDASTDAKGDAKGDAPSDAPGEGGLCDLAKCPTPPGNAAKCCAGVNICGYKGGSICYPLKDGGAGGAGGGMP